MKYRFLSLPKWYVHILRKNSAPLKVVQHIILVSSKLTELQYFQGRIQGGGGAPPGLAAPRQWKLAPLRRRRRDANFHLHSPIISARSLFLHRVRYKGPSPPADTLLIRKGAPLAYDGSLLSRYDAPPASTGAALAQIGPFRA